MMKGPCFCPGQRVDERNKPRHSRGCSEQDVGVCRLSQSAVPQVNEAASVVWLLLCPFLRLHCSTDYTHTHMLVCHQSLVLSERKPTFCPYIISFFMGRQIRYMSCVLWHRMPLSQSEFKTLKRLLGWLWQWQTLCQPTNLSAPI